MLLRWTVVIPVKGTAEAKSRLAGGDGLALAIALDTIDAAREVARVVVVTDPGVARTCEQLGVVVIADPGAGLGGAVAEGIAAAGPGPVAVMLGDLPALVPSELLAALTAAEDHRLAMVSDAENEGTTLITARHSGDHAPAFGVGSRAAHILAGYHELPLAASAGLRHDVDTVEQLAEVAARVGRRTRAAMEI